MKVHSPTPPVTVPTPSSRRRTMSAAVLAGLVLATGCSSSADYTAAAPAKKSSVEIPRWIRDGVRIARATKAARAEASGGGVASRDVSSILPVGSSGSSSGTLPSKSVVVAALAGAGLSAQQAGCVYDGVSASPQTAKDVAAILDGLAAAGAAQSPNAAPAAFDPATLPGLANLTPESTTRLVMAIAPCLDQATLLGLLAAGQGLGGATGAAGGAGALGSDQVKQVQQLLAAVGTNGQGLLNNPLLTLDVTKLDLSKLTPEQMPLLLLALTKGLTTEQQGQLSQLAQVKLNELNIKIDPDQLKPDEIGSLLLILSPLLAGAIKTTPVTAPPGADPNQVYIPPGADLSNMNPLIFLNRADVIAQFQKQGVDPNLGGCIFDGLSDLTPTTIAAFFSDAAPAAAGSVLLIAVSCLVQRR